MLSAPVLPAPELLLDVGVRPREAAARFDAAALSSRCLTLALPLVRTPTFRFSPPLPALHPLAATSVIVLVGTTLAKR